MRYFQSLSALALAVLPIFAAPTTRLTVRRSGTEGKADSYIVVLKDGVAKEAHIEALTNTFSTLAEDNGSELVYDYNIINGYSAILKGDALESVLADPAVAFVEADGVASIDYSEAEERSAYEEAQALAVRNLARRDAGGLGVVVYGIDTGIYIDHNEFSGRATWGATFGNYANADGNGHGTHTAASAVGATYGLAYNATVVAVKVLSDGGSGSWSDVIAGVDWSVAQALASGSPSIATMSLGGLGNTAIDLAVQAGIDAGVHFTIAAGNSAANTTNYSPARVPAANTIGAVNYSNVTASFSNWGPLLDVWYYGVSVTSAWIGSPSAINTISGTSMATPGVAGILAVALGEYGNKAPADLTADLVANGLPVVTGTRVPPSTNLLGNPW